LERSYVNGITGEAIIYALVGALLVFVFVAMSVPAVPAIRHDTRVWNAGGEEYPASVQGTVTTRKFIFRAYDLTVQYRTSDGRLHGAPVRFDTLFKPDEDHEPLVRVSPTNPDDFALRFAVSASDGRWASVVVFMLCGVGFGVACVAVVARILRKRRSAEEAARAGVLMEAKLIGHVKKTANGQPTGRSELTFEVPTPLRMSPTLDVTWELMDRAGPPVMTDAAHVLVLVPTDHPEASLPLQGKFYPLRLSSAELATATSALAAARAPTAAKPAPAPAKAPAK
jgi:hypothetical protein